VLRFTEWVCNWRGFAGANDRDCGVLYRAQCAPSTAVERARFDGWEFILDERLAARDLNPERPRVLILCPAHGSRWVEWFGPRYRIPERKMALFIAERMRRQTDLFPEAPRGAVVVGLHDNDNGEGSK